MTQGPPAALYLYGYNVDRRSLPVTAVKDHTTLVKFKGPQDYSLSVPVSISLGCHVDGAVLPKPACGPVNSALGYTSRVGRKFWPHNKVTREAFYRFVHKVKYLFPQIDSLEEFDIDDWLLNSGYNMKRQEVLRKCAQEMQPYGFRLPKRYTMCRGFVKDEHLLCRKPARTINSRSDYFKAVVGPVFHKIDKKIFSLPAFVKHVPVNDRPKYIMDMLGANGPYYATDYTAFESLFDPELIAKCELVIYEHILYNCPLKREFIALLRRSMCGYNKSVFRFFIGRVLGRRMSGEMCTSSGNGLTNFLLTHFAAWYSGASVRCVVEGDDGLFVVDRGHVDVNTFKDLGMEIKLCRHSSINRAAFCGMVFDENDLVNIPDIQKVICKTSWSPKRYILSNKFTRLALLKARAMSLLAQYAGCPVIQPFALMILRNTRNICVDRVINKMGYWDRTIIRQYTRFDNMIRPIGKGSRLLVEESFDVSVVDQLRIEKYFASCPIQPIPISYLPHVPMEWMTVYNLYTSWQPERLFDLRPGV